ncbi:hypothetical protein ES703_06905 [subsurface metagenome]
MEIKKKLLKPMEYITALAFWAFILAIGYGICLWTVDCLRNLDTPIHIRLAIGSGVTFLFGLILIFILDEEFFK